MPTPVDIWSVFVVHGPLGAIAVLAMWWAFRKDREANAIRDSKDVELKALHDQYKAEQKALQDRYVEKAESWMNQYHGLNREQTAVIAALEKRFP